MPTNRFKGDARTLAQVDTVVITAFDAATTYTVTINGKAVSVPGVVDAATTAAVLRAALVATLDGEFREITWTVLTNTITGTANTPGKPFTLTRSVTGGTGTIGGSTTTANSGPSDISVPGNWTLGAIPVAADDVFFDEMSKADALYGLSAITAVVLTSLNVIGYTRRLGLPEHNGSYREYRTTHLEFRATTVNIDSQQCGRCKLNATATITTFNVRASGSPADVGQKAVMVKGSTFTTAVITGGNVGFAFQSGETHTITTLRMSGQGTQVEGGTGLTVGTIDKQGGTLELNSAVGTLLTNWAGNVTINGTGAVAVLTAYGGTITYNTTGALGGASVVAGTAHLDFSQDPATKTVTNPIEKHGRQSRISDPQKVVASLVIDCNQDDITGINIGQNVRVTRGTPA